MPYNSYPTEANIELLIFSVQNYQQKLDLLGDNIRWGEHDQYSRIYR